jgi:hypothetical protein
LRQNILSDFLYNSAEQLPLYQKRLNQLINL